jgi:fatty acid desaturase
VVSYTHQNAPSAHQHRLFSIRLLVETWLIFLALLAGAYTLQSRSETMSQLGLCFVIFCLGCWFHRLYTNAHEAIHKKLFPEKLWLNDLMGQLLLLPLLIPLPVYRKIHAFHHGHNRRDHATSTLDGYVVKRAPGQLKRAWIHALWYGGVFLGGYFIHGVISIILFLCLPHSVAIRVSPAFKAWRVVDQLHSWAVFIAGIGLHVGVAWAVGIDTWAVMFGYPFLVFAWVYSLLVYIYHYRTSYGPEVRFNVRSVKTHPFFSWWLLNFNEHATHHRLPKTPWYRLPIIRQPLPEAQRDNNNMPHVRAAIWQQWKGASIFEEE